MSVVTEKSDLRHLMFLLMILFEKISYQCFFEKAAFIRQGPAQQTYD